MKHKRDDPNFVYKKYSRWSTNVLGLNSNTVKGKISDLQDCKMEQPRTQKREQRERYGYGQGKMVYLVVGDQAVLFVLLLFSQ